MKILVLNGSPRVNGNSANFAAAFEKGASRAGHDVTIINVAQLHISGCTGCEFCHGPGEGKCAIRDDMIEVRAGMINADMVVFASPIHYWSFTGQMQCVISRFYAELQPKIPYYAMILSSGSENVYDAPISQYRSMLEWFGAKDLGIFTFAGEDQLTEENLKKIEEFGAGLK